MKKYIHIIFPYGQECLVYIVFTFGIEFYDDITCIMVDQDQILILCTTNSLL